MKISVHRQIFVFILIIQSDLKNFVKKIKWFRKSLIIHMFMIRNNLLYLCIIINLRSPILYLEWKRFKQKPQHKMIQRIPGEDIGKAKKKAKRLETYKMTDVKRQTPRNFVSSNATKDKLEKFHPSWKIWNIPKVKLIKIPKNLVNVQK